jgi:integral membrane protein
MKKSFIITGWFEGVSLLLLFFVAMPMKYIWGNPQMVKIVGMAHGALFVLYILGAIILFSEENWTGKKLGLAVLLSSVPFGTFIFERKYL